MAYAEVPPDAPLEIRERTMHELLDGIAEWVEGCYKEHPNEGIILTTLHLNPDGSRSVQVMLGGDITVLHHMLTKLSMDVSRLTEGAIQRGELQVIPWPPEPEGGAS